MERRPLGSSQGFSLFFVFDFSGAHKKIRENNMRKQKNVKKTQASVTSVAVGLDTDQQKLEFVKLILRP